MKRIVTLVAITISILTLPSLGYAEEIIITVKGMVCSFCAQGIKKTFMSKEGVEKVEVNLDTKVVTITTAKGHSLQDADVKDSITDAGYELVSLERKTDA